MEEKTKMSWKFLRFSKFKEKTAKTKQPPEQPLRQVYANARAGDKHGQRHFNHAMNRIQTSKYTIFTFLPFNLWEQFHRFANIYFLVLILLQAIPLISSLEPITTIIPLVIVLGITAFKDGLDDYNRHKSDRLVNNREVEFLDPQVYKLRKEKWMHIRTGDVIKIQQDSQVTADVILLSTADLNNLAFIETAELDGETNLKVRTALPATADLMPSDVDHFGGDEVLRLAAFDGRVECEPPNNILDKFTGTLVWRDPGDKREVRHPVSNENVLLRGTTLRNCAWAFGLVIFAGPDTKLMQNTGRTHFKRTSIDNFLNTLVLYIGVALVVFALISSVGHVVFELNWGVHFQLYLPYVDAVRDFIFPPWANSGCLIFWSYIIILNTLVPISLYVSVEIIRLGQSFFINWDRQMYYSAKDTPAMARTTTLNEELGQVQYIFSDKTGTLTQNIMQFKMASIQGHWYGKPDEDSSPCDLASFNPRHSVPGFEFADNQLLIDIVDQRPGLAEFFLLLALNHTVMPSGDGYQAQSPDEGALVTAAKAFGFVFKSRTPSSITIYEATKDREVTYELLQILDFDNVRKRMSVAVRRREENGELGPIMLYTKGADTMVMERLREPTEEDGEIQKQTKIHLDEFSGEGLRTLCLAYREIPQEEWNDWSKRHYVASTSVLDRDERLAEVYEEIESRLILLGATAVEDKLQDGVPETIANLAKAGIKLWVLTGDKQETAINIGYSCNLLTDDMADVFIIDDHTRGQVREQLRIDIGVLAQRQRGDYGLVVTGAALDHALSEELEETFVDLALKCTSVICCRVTPLQKARIVELVKRSQSAVTLAIGDGANDVSMIKEAQIGIGISGEEGTQAVLASDFSIAQFKYLERLLLVHGRWSYYRMCKFLDYFFYKNFAFTLIHFWFGFVNGFSASNSYDQWMITMYNVFYTSFPPLCIGLLDKDVNDRSCLQHPRLYRLGQQNKLFNLRIFFYSVLRGLITSMILFFVPFGIFFETVGSSENFFGAGKTIGQQGFAFAVGSCLVLIVNIQVALDTSYWTIINHFFIWASVLFYFAANFSMFSNGWYTALGHFTVKSFPFVGVGRFMVRTPQFWSCIALTLVIYVCPVLTFRLYKNITKPSDVENVKCQQKKERRLKRKGQRAAKIRGGSQRPGNQRPGSSYAFSHEKGFAELIMSGRMTSQRRRRESTRPTPHVLNELVESTVREYSQHNQKVKFETELPRQKDERLVE